MALAIKISNVQAAGQQLRVAFNITPSGNYITGGDTLDFTTATQDPAFVGMLAAIESFGPAVSLDVWDASGNIANGVFPIIGTALNNNKLKFTSAFNTELGAGAYPGSLTGGKLQGEAIFNKL